MSRFFALRPRWAFLTFIVIDLVCFAMGMGVPVFCILLGFVVGWYAARSITTGSNNIREILLRTFKYAVATSLFTFLVLAIAWGRCFVWLCDPQADFAGFGIPMILFEPRASFVGWLILMIFISPFLQLLSTVFSSYLTLLRWAARK